MKVIISILLLLQLPGILPAQNVGIGTPTPSARLEISKPDSNLVILENTSPSGLGSSSALYFKNGGYFTGAVRTLGEQQGYSGLGFYTFATQQASSLKP